jgi:hypothetical protein
MKKFFLIVVAFALPFSLTACGDSVDKLVDETAALIKKCSLTKEYDQSQCKQKSDELEQRVKQLSKEEDAEYKDKLTKKVKEDWDKFTEEQKAKKK